MVNLFYNTFTRLINLSSSESTDFLKAKGTVRTLINTGFVSFFNLNDMGEPLVVPIPSAKTSGNLLIKSSFDTLLIILIQGQKSSDSFNHVLPIRLGPSSLITSKFKFGISLTVTSIINSPNIVKSFFVKVYNFTLDLSKFTLPVNKVSFLTNYGIKNIRINFEVDSFSIYNNRFNER